jgi:hypothetical protein
MTLRLRRGTDLARQSIVFQEGELVYITDTKDLYAGDGTTVGGIKVSNIGSPSSLTQNLNLNGYSIQGSGTISATSFVGDGSGLTGIDIGVQSGQEYDISIRGAVRGYDSTVLVDPASNTIFGNFFGDGTNLVNVPGTIVPSGEYTINVTGYIRAFDNDILVDAETKTMYGDFIGTHQGSLRAEDSTLLIDSNSSSFFGTFIGDGSLLSNISLTQIAEVGIVNPTFNDVLFYDGSSWVNLSASDIGISEGGNYKISVVGLDSTIIVDATTGTVTADRTNTSRIFHSSGDVLIVTSAESGESTVLMTDSVDNTSELRLRRTSNSAITDDMVYGKLTFEKTENFLTTTSAIIGADNLGLFFSYNSNGVDFDESTYITYSFENKLGIGTFSPTERLDVRGNAVVTGTVTAASFNGSVVADDSTTIIDAINGSIVASNYVMFGRLTTSERDALFPENGMVIYNTTANRFQGYQNNSWINIDDGTSA